MSKVRILWADDEIDLLKPYVYFLQEKGYEIKTASNGDDALNLVRSEHFDIIFLDENMPGISGLETLNRIKRIYPGIPVIMVTKSEEEDIMDEAIGSKISDYLIKPVNPKQILLTIKKNIDNKRLITKKTTSAYQSAFRDIGMKINENLSHSEWCDLYKRLIFWELELSGSNDNTMDEVLIMQKSEANKSFGKFISNNYSTWFGPGNDNKPLLSPAIFKDKIFPMLDQDQKVFFILVDNLRFDQWKVLQPVIREYFKLEEEDIYFSILPTATQYSRNAIFAGLMPSDIEKTYPDLWLNDEDEGQKNTYEKELLEQQLRRSGKNIKFFYDKINDPRTGKRLVEQINNILNNQLCVVVFNFVDMLSHARTEMKMIKQLAEDESAYRSLTLSWFEHSPLLDLLKELAVHDVKVVITTDHGTIRVNNPVKVIGDKKTTTNLRYKQGKSLSYNPKEVFEIDKPIKALLPQQHVSSAFIFATNDDFFVYPNNYNHYVKYYKNTFQHGGISLEEMLIPFITLSPK